MQIHNQSSILCKPFLKWAGGKRWLTAHLVGRLPKFKNYYEPFLGSGCLFFALQPNRAVLADRNFELINCYRQVRNRLPRVLKVLTSLKLNKTTYYKVRDDLYADSDNVHRAAFFIYLNKMAFNGLYRVNKKGQFNVPVGRVPKAKSAFDMDNLRFASKLLKKAELLEGDFKETVSGIKKNDLVYFDPPYVTTHLENGFIKYNSKLFSHNDEVRLAALANKLRTKGIHVLVSNAANKDIKKLYEKEFKFQTFSRVSSIAANSNNRTKYPELLVTNLNLNVSN